MNDVYEVTGGNSRAILELAFNYDWRIGERLEKIERAKIRPILDELRTSKDLLDKIKEACMNPNVLLEYPRLLRILEEYNLVTYIVDSRLGVEPKHDPELGVGEYIAWHIPAYPIALRKTLGWSKAESIE